ncbi:MAG: VTT domain-containing protein [Candidatus Omnitrophica bacterium]|nr:VTT domain-containing protein [Candidatus Omnitrophota bacterium]
MEEFFSHLYQFDELIRWGGYTVLVGVVFAETGLLAGFFLPGDSLVFLSAAAIAGDSTGYAIGYHLGPRLFSREDSRFFHKAHLVRTQRFYERYGVKTIILARFVPIVRTFAPTVAGVGKMRYPTFLTFNIVGGVGWVVSMTLAGYGLGRVVPDIERYLHWVIAVVIVVSFLPLVREWRRSRRSPARQPSPAEPTRPLLRT